MISTIVLICIVILFTVLIKWISSPKIIGTIGEKRVSRRLDWLPKEYITLNDILLPTNYGTTQIDHIKIILRS